MGKRCPACGKTHGEKDIYVGQFENAIAEYNERTRLAQTETDTAKIVEMLEELSSDRVKSITVNEQREVNGEMQVIPRESHMRLTAEARRLTRYAHMIEDVNASTTAALSEFATERDVRVEFGRSTLGSFFDSTEK
ncbi:hypothetical protein SPFM12_00259 [Salmonella phage SPFM12]|nr:hypothetical protein SPFM12_00259 [Salmonella phage SPFM12]